LVFGSGDSVLMIPSNEETRDGLGDSSDRSNVIVGRGPARSSTDVSSTTSRWAAGAPGLALLLLGVATFVYPGFAVQGLVVAFGIAASCYGLNALLAAVVGDPADRTPLTSESLIVLGLGVLTLVRPGLTELALLYIIAGWVVSVGIFELSTAASTSRDVPGHWLPAMAGVITGGVGLYLVHVPQIGLLALAWLIGGYAFSSGIILISRAIRRLPLLDCGVI
jgi:uncharacterized membrane protein HdeD (DUF308 family)